MLLDKNESSQTTQNFVVSIPLTYENIVDPFELTLNVVGINEPNLAHISPSYLTISSEKKPQNFEVSYDCPILLSTSKSYFDTVLITLADETSSI